MSKIPIPSTENRPRSVALFAAGAIIVAAFSMSERRRLAQNAPWQRHGADLGSRL